MLSAEAFDRWSASYDADVRACVEADEYPFAGYFDALEQLAELVNSRDGSMTVLDLGIGTGVLAARLAENGHSIFGVDFSLDMLDSAAQKLPDAFLFQHDLTQGLPNALMSLRADFIIASYSLHHLTDAQKVELLRALRWNLKPDGVILLADVSFPTRVHMEECREAYADVWDAEECYLIEDELRAALPEYHIDTIPVSFCADVWILTPEDEA